ncbi:Uncharacterised protein [Serratia grimesii]|nr:Uncharacterised protein [Serratia grimesii]
MTTFPHTQISAPNTFTATSVSPLEQLCSAKNKIFKKRNRYLSDHY